jgi:hypothetical protein
MMKKENSFTTVVAAAPVYRYTQQLSRRFATLSRRLPPAAHVKRTRITPHEHTPPHKPEASQQNKTAHKAIPHHNFHIHVHIFSVI